MNAPAFPTPTPRQTGRTPQPQRRERHRHEPLSDDQYLATSLALVANLSQRMRHAGKHHHG